MEQEAAPQRPERVGAAADDTPSKQAPRAAESSESSGPAGSGAGAGAGAGVGVGVGAGQGLETIKASGDSDDSGPDSDSDSDDSAASDDVDSDATGAGAGSDEDDDEDDGPDSDEEDPGVEQARVALEEVRAELQVKLGAVGEQDTEPKTDEQLLGLTEIRDDKFEETSAALGEQIWYECDVKMQVTEEDADGAASGAATGGAGAGKEEAAAQAPAPTHSWKSVYFRVLRGFLYVYTSHEDAGYPPLEEEGEEEVLFSSADEVPTGKPAAQVPLELVELCEKQYDLQKRKHKKVAKKLKREVVVRVRQAPPDADQGAVSQRARWLHDGCVARS